MVTKPRDSLCIVYPGETGFPYGLAQSPHHLDSNVHAFERLKVRNVYLYRMVNGERGEMDQYHERCRPNTKRDRIRTDHSLPYNELPVNCMTANGLLIAPRPTMQDEARIRLKICEYLASCILLNTSLPGEIKYYFESIIR